MGRKIKTKHHKYLYGREPTLYKLTKLVFYLMNITNLKICISVSYVT